MLVQLHVSRLAPQRFVALQGKFFGREEKREGGRVEERMGEGEEKAKKGGGACLEIIWQSEKKWESDHSQKILETPEISELISVK